MKRGVSDIIDLDSLFDGKIDDSWIEEPYLFHDEIGTRIEDFDKDTIEIDNACKIYTEIEMDEIHMPEVILAAQNNDINRLLELADLGFDLAQMYQGISALKFALEYENVEMLKILLTNENPFSIMDFYKRNEAGDNLITLAAVKKDINLIKIIYEKYLQLISIENAQGKTAFDIAFENNHYALIKYFLKQGIVTKNSPSLNKINRHGYTLLMLAVENNDMETLDLLLDLKPDVNLSVEKNNVKKTALLLASDCANMKIIWKLLKAGAGDSAQFNAFNIRGKPLIIEAAQNHDIELIEFLSEKGVDLNIRTHNLYCGKTALDIASDNGNRKVIKKLLECGAGDKIQLNRINLHGNTLLMLATLNDDLELIEILYKLGADFNVRGGSHKTALDLAMSFFKDVNLIVCLSDNYQALERFLPVQKFSTLSKLIQCGAGSLEEIDSPINNICRLVSLAILLEDVKLVEELYVRGIDFHQVDYHCSPISRIGSINLINKLLELGERFFHCYQNDDLFSVWKSVMLDDINSFNLLSADIDFKNMMLHDLTTEDNNIIIPLTLALKFNSMQVAKRLIEISDVCDVTMCEVYENAFDSLDFLKKSGVNISPKLVQMAIVQRDLEKVCKLLELGVDLKIDVQSTALHTAVKNMSTASMFASASFEVIKALAYHNSMNELKYTIEKVGKCPINDNFKKNVIYLYKNSHKKWVFALKTNKVYKNNPLPEFSEMLNSIENLSEKNKNEIFNKIRDHIVAQGFIITNRFLSGEYAAIKDKSSFTPINLFRRKNSKKVTSQFESFIQYLFQDVKNDAAYYVAHSILSQTSNLNLDKGFQDLKKALSILYHPGLPWELKEFIWDQARYHIPDSYTVQYTMKSDTAAKGLADLIIKRDEYKKYDLKACEDKSFLTQYFIVKNGNPTVETQKLLTQSLSCKPR